MPIAVAGGATTSPGNLTLGKMQNLVLRYLQLPQKDPDLNDEAADGIDDGVSVLNERDWFKVLGFQDVTLVADQADYDADDDVRDPFHCERLDASGNPDGLMGFRDFKSFLTEFSRATQSGSPKIYTFMYDQIRQWSLQIAPDSTFVGSWPTLRFRYHRRIPRLSDAGDTIGASPEFDWFLIWHARAELAANRDPGKMARAQAKADRKLAALIQDDNNIQSDFVHWG